MKIFSNKISLAASFGIIVVAFFIARYMVLCSIVLTPLILNLFSAFFSFLSKKIHPLLKCLLVSFFISFYDVIIRFFAFNLKGTISANFVIIFFVLGIIPAYSVYISGILKFNTKESTAIKVISIVLFPLLIAIHFYFVQASRQSV